MLTGFVRIWHGKTALLKQTYSCNSCSVKLAFLPLVVSEFRNAQQTDACGAVHSDSWPIYWCVSGMDDPYQRLSGSAVQKAVTQRKIRQSAEWVLIWKLDTEKNGRKYFPRLRLLKRKVFPWSSTERLEIWSATAWHTEFPTSSLIF